MRLYNGIDLDRYTGRDTAIKLVAADPALLDQAKRDLEALTEQSERGHATMTRDDWGLLYGLRWLVPDTEAYVNQERVDVVGRTYRVGDRIAYAQCNSSSASLGLGKVVSFNANGSIKWIKEGGEGRPTNISNINCVIAIGE